MPVKKKYASNAARQAAYRARHPEKHLPTEAELAILARSLQIMLSASVEAGTCPLPSALVSGRTDLTLKNLIRYLDPHPDPIRYTGPVWEMTVNPAALRENFLPREAL